MLRTNWISRIYRLELTHTVLSSGLAVPFLLLSICIFIPRCGRCHTDTGAEAEESKSKSSEERRTSFCSPTKRHLLNSSFYSIAAQVLVLTGITRHLFPFRVSPTTALCTKGKNNNADSAHPERTAIFFFCYSP